MKIDYFALFGVLFWALILSHCVNNCTDNAIKHNKEIAEVVAK